MENSNQLENDNFDEQNIEIQQESDSTFEIDEKVPKWQKAFTILIIIVSIVVCVGLLFLSYHMHIKQSKEQWCQQTGHCYKIIDDTSICTANVVTKVCSNCGDTITVEQTPPGHNYYKIIDDTSTCMEDGIITKICSDCDSTTTLPQVAKGHDWNCYSKEVTCLEDGYFYYACKKCGELKKEFVEHSNEYCDLEFLHMTDNGYLVYQCTLCNLYQSVQSPLFETTSPPSTSTKPKTEYPSFGTKINYNHEYFFYCTTAAKNYITGFLKYPSSSTFQKDGDMIVYKSENNYTCVGYVDAANAFNAKERKYFYVTMKITLYGDKFSYSVVDYEIY